MKNKIIFEITAGVALILLLCAPAFAQGPVNTDPGTTLVFDNLPHSIPANTALWYAFFYAGDKSPITITLFNAANTGLGFDIYTPNQVQRLRSEDKPLGRGTAASVTCNSGKCPSADLTWNGSSPTPGPYFVKATNSAPKTQVFNMAITGTGVEIGPPLEVPPSAPSSFAIVPFTAPFPAPPNPLPENALPVRDNQSQVIPANSALWYRFNYIGDRSPILITLPDGVNSGLTFRIYTADQVKQLGANYAVVAQADVLLVDCAAGKCPTSDLGWLGAFSASGTYYVQVLNANVTPMTFRLWVDGTGVRLGQ